MVLGLYIYVRLAFSVIYHRSVPRVDGQLAMARAIGDEKLKEHITSEPDVAIVMMDTDVKFIILADDGLWNVRFFRFHFNK